MQACIVCKKKKVDKCFPRKTNRSCGACLEKKDAYYQANKSALIASVNKYNKERDQGLYIRYWSIVSKCRYKSHSRYKYFGAIGITTEWENYKAFKADMQESYLKHKAENEKTYLNRKETNKNFSKENCYWGNSYGKPRKA